MDASLYKFTTTSRGFKYHHFSSPPQDSSKPTVLFLHGFPSSSHGWHRVVPFFIKEGFGVLVPDLLGYGLTDKPDKTPDYVVSKMCKDVIEIVDIENVGKPIVVGHDWGSTFATRLAHFHPERFIAFAFLTVAYVPPFVNFDYQKYLETTKAAAGFDQFSYMAFFADDNAPKIIEEHWDSFFSAAYPKDSTPNTHADPHVAFKGHVLADMKGPLPSYFTEEDKIEHSKHILRDGIQGPLRWYKALMDQPSLMAADDGTIPQENYIVNQPTFYGGGTHDYICVPKLGRAAMEKYCPRATLYEFDADHWFILSHPKELSDALLKWIEDEVLVGA